MRIFLDANILFSAAKSDGAVRRLLVLLRNARHDCWIDGYVLAEARRNLAAKHPAAVEALDALVLDLRMAGLHPTDSALMATFPLPEKDKPVLAAAIRQRCSALVTGDRTHFGPLYGKAVHGVMIHSPRSLAEAVLGKAR
jgi:uncharacterized protein